MDDFDKIHELTAYSYGFDSVGTRERMIKRFELTCDENFLVEVDKQIVANARAIPFEQNIRGNLVKMNGIAMVVSAPEMRRRGYVRELMNYLLKKMYNDGFDTSTLYPFKDTFYGRYGYVNAPPFYKIEINPNVLRKWRNLPEGYTVKRERLSDVFNLYKELHQEAMLKIHGGVPRSEKRWKEYEGPSPVWCAVAYNDTGKVEGILLYITKGFSSGFSWSEEGTLNTIQNAFFTRTAKAKAAIFGYLYLHADQIVKITLPIYVNETDYYPWFSDYFMVDYKLENIFMARIVNVKTTLEKIHSQVDGKIILKITDDIIEQNNGFYEITANKKKISVKTIKDAKDYTELTIEGITALVYGLLTTDEIEAFSWFKTNSNDDKKLLDEMFPPKKPTLTEGF